MPWGKRGTVERVGQLVSALVFLQLTYSARVRACGKVKREFHQPFFGPTPFSPPALTTLAKGKICKRIPSNSEAVPPPSLTIFFSNNHSFHRPVVQSRDPPVSPGTNLRKSFSPPRWTRISLMKLRTGGVGRKGTRSFFTWPTVTLGGRWGYPKRSPI